MIKGTCTMERNLCIVSFFIQEKISGPSHNALLQMGFSVQVVMWGDSDKTYLN